MHVSSFDSFIEQQSKSTQTTEVDWFQRRDEWIGYLESFYDSVEDYLSAYIKTGKIRLERDDICLQEEYIGDYKAPQLVIHLGNNKIILKPIGTNLIGVKGRVDMIGPKGDVKFVLVGKDSSGPKISIQIGGKGDKPISRKKHTSVIELAWKIATPPPRISYIELGQESFQSALMEVVNG